jgi:D-alanyl-D-alanine carboxypeptidase
MDKDTKDRFYIRSVQNDDTRSIVVPKYVADHKRKQFIVHSLIAILIGVSVPYFLIDLGKTSLNKVSGMMFGNKILPHENMVVDNNKVEKNLGSDDVDNIEDEADVIPKGKNVFINPDIKGQYYFLGPNYKIPKTSALAYVVADVDTGEVIIEKNPDMIMPIASISKLITSVVTKENMDLHGTVTVTRSSIDTYGKSGGLRVGEKILVNDLLYPLLMESSNDAAEVLAYGYDRDAFIKLMNKKVKDIGMTNSSFDEPSGLSAKNVSTAADLQKLLKYITTNYPELWDISRVRQYSILKHTWGNSSSISRKPTFIGGKNGFTYEAYSTTASIFELNIEGGSRRIAVTLLKSNSRENDVDLLLRFVANWVGFLPEGEEL